MNKHHQKSVYTTTIEGVDFIIGDETRIVEPSAVQQKVECLREMLLAEYNDNELQRRFLLPNALLNKVIIMMLLVNL